MNADELRAEIELARTLFEGDGRRKSYKRALPHLLTAARCGHPLSQNQVGYCLNLGLGTPRNVRQAAMWYRRAVAQGHTEAMYNLATMYAAGELEKPQPKQAFALYLAAAKLGHLWSQTNLGLMYLEGEGTKLDSIVGARWMKKAAARGDDKAQYNLGLCYLDGTGVRADRTRARSLFAQAANKGNKKALRQLRRRSA